MMRYNATGNATHDLYNLIEEHTRALIARATGRLRDELAAQIAAMGGYVLHTIPNGTAITVRKNQQYLVQNLTIAPGGTMTLLGNAELVIL
jgi:hypothetical protein